MGGALGGGKEAGKQGKEGGPPSRPGRDSQKSLVAKAQDFDAASPPFRPGTRARGRRNSQKVLVPIESGLAEIAGRQGFGAAGE
jgi:hypothetical protein